MDRNSASDDGADVDATTPWSWLDWLVIGVVAAPFLVGIVALLAGAHPSVSLVGDNAINELRIRDVGNHAVLVGPYSRDGWNHPGPLLYYLLAVPYRLFGSRSAGIVVGALIINALSAVGMVAIARRVAGRMLMIVTASAVGLLFVNLGALYLRDPWNPRITVLPFGLFLYAAWALACGREWYLPVAAVAGTFCVQSHIGYAPLILVVGLWAIGTSLWGRRTRGSAPPTTPTRAPTAVILVTVGLLGLMWIGPLVDQLGRGRNLSRTVSYFSQDAPTKGFRAAARVVGHEFTVTPDWVVGTKAASQFTGEPTSLLHTPWPWLGAAIIGIAVVSWHRTRRELRVLATGVTVTVCACLLAIAQTIGPLYDYRLRFLWVVAATAAGVAIAMGINRWATPRALRSATILLVATVVGLAGVATVQAATSDLPEPTFVRTMTSIDREVLARLPARPGVIVIRRASLTGGLFTSALAVSLESAEVPIRFEATRELPAAVGAHRMLRGERVRGVLTLAVDQEIEELARFPHLREIAYHGAESRARRAKDLAELRRLYLSDRDAPPTAARTDRIRRLADRTHAVAVYFTPSLTG